MFGQQLALKICRLGLSVTIICIYMYGSHFSCVGPQPTELFRRTQPTQQFRRTQPIEQFPVPRLSPLSSSIGLSPLNTSVDSAHWTVPSDLSLSSSVWLSYLNSYVWQQPTEQFRRTFAWAVPSDSAHWTVPSDLTPFSSSVSKQLSPSTK